MNTYGLHKEYHKLSNGKELKIELNFNRSTYSWGTGATKQIGYEGSYTPCIRGDMFEEISGADAGNYEVILATPRQSKKRLEEAKTILKARIPEVVAYFEKRIHPQALSYKELHEMNAMTDNSGIEDPNNWLWEKGKFGDCYYPTIKIIGK